MTGAVGLPRLLYVGDVPVEASYHGSLLFHRLFAGLDPDRLAIIECGTIGSSPERRLPGVAYRAWPAPVPRAHRSRFARLARSMAFLRARWRLPPARLYADVRPQAVITVAHGTGWLAAARLARQLALPLHLVVHDDPAPENELPASLVGTYLDEFHRVYREAESRLCVSSPMVRAMAERHGVDGTALLPCRGAGATVHPVATTADAPAVFAFAGTINSPGYVAALIALADAIATFDARLDIFGPITPADANAAGLTRPNVRLRGLLSPDELARVLHEEADVLYAPMSFDQADAANMRLSFPSKLVDYTRTGRPILLHAPADTAAAAWVDEHDAAELVIEPAGPALVSAVERLRDPRRREAIARRAEAAGNASFAHGQAVEVLKSALRAGAPG